MNLEPSFHDFCGFFRRHKDIKGYCAKSVDIKTTSFVKLTAK